MNVRDDLTIPSDPEPNWPLHNNFRSGDLNPVYGRNAPDAIPLADFCTAECSEGRLYLDIKLGNQGTATLREDLNITVYRVVETEWTPLETIRVSPPIHPGYTSEPFEVVIDAARLGGGHVAISVDDEDGVEAIRECDEENNSVVLADATCG